ncbi:GGDEF and EAL domain-containing protein [Microvirga sp. BT689]|uniref:putative bifunctional diguanylate cyclase/phosphodiesterase n=1 Tax=Microvirga arvi TaxID=2778731 RepID=UPI00194F0386|nr:GGDEF and EAL domain-containing protein [Microvirga arvi]MBM6584136.1 GGDEF and EAL domain-containing protein [Microvirga arvi]
MSGMLNTSQELAHQQDPDERFNMSTEILTTLINNVPGLIYAAEPKAPWLPAVISDGATGLTGYQAADFTSGRLTWTDIVFPDDLDNLRQAKARAHENRRLFSVEYRIMTRSGKIRWVLDRGRFTYDQSGEAVALEGFVSDLTEQKRAEECTKWAIYHDTLTQLPNRALFQKTLNRALDRCDPSSNIGLLFLDMDHLKHVNDTLGHDAGDIVLQTTAHRLRSVADSTSTVARIGGDEFAIILPHVTSNEELAALAEDVLDRLAEPFSFKGHSLDCCASIGASLVPSGTSGASELLKHAGIALDVARANGRSRAVVFNPTMLADVEHRATMLSNARRAITERRIAPFYQPKIVLESGRLAGFEALLRWRNPEGQMETPETIQAAFADARLAMGMGRQVLAAVIEDMRGWLEAGLEFGHVAVNASSAEFQSGRFAEQLLNSLRQAGVPTSCLELEVTETVFLGTGAEGVTQALRTLSSEGVRIALDDFGTGYASLLHLKQHPIDVLKIDQSFIRNLPSSPEDAAILSAVLDLGRNLGLTTVAEGIETAAQAEYLRAAGCDQGQGFFFRRPTPRDAVVDVIAAWQPHLAHRADDHRGHHDRPCH